MSRVTVSQLLNELNEGRGLQCPHCGCRHFEVSQTRQAMGQIVRHRICRHCGKRLLTAEVPLSRAHEVERAPTIPQTDSNREGTKRAKTKNKRRTETAETAEIE